MTFFENFHNKQDRFFHELIVEQVFFFLISGFTGFITEHQNSHGNAPHFLLHFLKPITNLYTL